MIVPIRCFTCGKSISWFYDYYVKECASLEEKNPEPAMEGFKHFDKHHKSAILDVVGCTRSCCRRHLLTTVDMMEKI